MSENCKPEDLLEFPCHFQFKALGVAGEAFSQNIVTAITLHVSVPADAVHCRPSGKGKYQSISVLVTLYHYEQLTCIYADMRKVAGLKLLL